MSKVIAPTLPLPWVVAEEPPPAQSVGYTSPSAPADVHPTADEFAALREVLETTGHFTPAPAEPPWTDPRPDLVADHAHWEDLLGRAWRLDAADPEGVYGALNGIRCCAARLERTQPAGWRIVRGDELSEQEWHDLRERWLLPHKDAITKLLGAPEPVAARSPAAASARRSPPPRPTAPAARRVPADEVYSAADRLPLLAGGAR